MVLGHASSSQVKSAPLVSSLSGAFWEFLACICCQEFTKYLSFMYFSNPHQVIKNDSAKGFDHF